MSINAAEIDGMLDQIRQLPPDSRLLLIQKILETIVSPSPPSSSRLLRFGEYKEFDGPMSTEEDFVLAEWNPSARELNGE